MQSSGLLARQLIAVPQSTAAELGSLSFDGHKIATEHPAARHLVDYWSARRRYNGLVPRASIRPCEIKEVLPYIFIAEPIDHGWRYRLSGTGITRHVGVEFTGKFVREVFDLESAMTFSWQYSVVSDYRQPLSRKGRIFGSDPAGIQAETVQLPVLAPDGSTILVLGGFFFGNHRTGR